MDRIRFGVRKPSFKLKTSHSGAASSEDEGTKRKKSKKEKRRVRKKVERLEQDGGRVGPARKKK